MAAETVVKYVCRECGADYTSGSPAKRMHVHQDAGWRRVKVTREALPSRILYQPGYGPEGGE